MRFLVYRGVAPHCNIGDELVGARHFACNFLGYWQTLHLSSYAGKHEYWDIENKVVALNFATLSGLPSQRRAIPIPNSIHWRSDTSYGAPLASSASNV